MTERQTEAPDPGEQFSQTRRLFLERRSYRQRRLADALRALPVLALALWMIPLIWPKGSEAEGSVSTSSATLYVFGIWYLLIVAGAVLSVRLGPAEQDVAAGSVPDETAPDSPARRKG